MLRFASPRSTWRMRLMTVPQSKLILASRVCACIALNIALVLVGCTPGTIEISPTTKADQKRMLEKDTDQTARNKSGKTLGRPVPAKSIKAKVLGASQ